MRFKPIVSSLQSLGCLVRPPLIKERGHWAHLQTFCTAL